MTKIVSLIFIFPLIVSSLAFANPTQEEIMIQATAILHKEMAITEERLSSLKGQLENPTPLIAEGYLKAQEIASLLPEDPNSYFSYIAIPSYESYQNSYLYFRNSLEDFGKILM